MVLRGTVPSGYGNAHAVWWMAETVDSSGFLHTLWTHRSTDGIPSGGLAPGDHVDFGAPGLPENSSVRFRVTFEDASGLKLCWSDRSIEYSTIAFDSAGEPTLPSDIYLKVQDDYDRPETHALDATPPGDGLGPEAVWTSRGIGSSTAHEVRIAEDGSHALVAPSTSIQYETTKEQFHHSLAESKLRVDLARSSGVTIPYNLQIQARIGDVDPSTGEAPSYAVKLLKGVRDCDRSVLVAFRLPDAYGQASCDSNGNPLPSTEGVFCEDPITGEEPPLENEDPNYAGLSRPVWLRIEVANSQPPSNDPVVEGTVFWQDSQGNWRSCSVRRPFEGDPGNMKGILGKWGMSFHDVWYRLDWFKAGDGAQP
ncbi:MAG: hypothetical protein Q9Q40_04275 [Acidobacteriota bacterium]|nr:hypothetical protein [Acidobacteriota bacterium]